jgi:undecaprenyl-phosphate 4-deoxy-4-formamido-L-arabinose transferase
MKYALSHYYEPILTMDADFSHHPRHIGESNYTFRRLVAHAVALITNSSTLPLRLASWVGFVCVLFGVVVLAWVLGNYIIRGTSQPGFPFLASITAIFAGAQLFALGILGEYMAQIHCRLMEKPTYVIHAETAAESAWEDAA